MKEKSHNAERKYRQKGALKTFLWLFFGINFFGISLNLILHYYKLPNQIEYLIHNSDNIAIISLALFCYIIMSLLLYLVISLNYFFKEV